VQNGFLSLSYQSFCARTTNVNLLGSKSAQLICNSQDQYEHAGERYIFAGWRDIVSLENLLF
jgi:hypothetical protein